MTTRAARQQHILDRLESRGEVTVESLSVAHAVSEMTIRRDLDALAAAGRLRRVHGGAVAVGQGGSIAFSFPAMADDEASAKTAVAREVLDLVEPRMTLSLDTGTTTLAVARALAEHTPKTSRRLTVLTTSLAIAAVLQTGEDIETVLLGGRVRRHNPDLTGPLTEDNLQRFSVDLAIMGADAITREGTYTTDLDVSRVTAAMAARARRVVLVADSTKIGRTAFHRCQALAQVDVLITDQRCPAAERVWLEDAIAEVRYVDVGRGA